MNDHDSTGYWWLWTLPVCLKAVLAKFYFQADGLFVSLGNSKFWLMFQERSKRRKKQRKKEQA